HLCALRGSNAPFPVRPIRSMSPLTVFERCGALASTSACCFACSEFVLAVCGVPLLKAALNKLKTHKAKRKIENLRVITFSPFVIYRGILRVPARGKAQADAYGERNL